MKNNCVCFIEPCKLPQTQWSRLKKFILPQIKRPEIKVKMSVRFKEKENNSKGKNISGLCFNFFWRDITSNPLFPRLSFGPVPQNHSGV